MTRSDFPCVPTTEPTLVVVTGRKGVAEQDDRASGQFLNLIYYNKECAREARAKAKKCRCGIQATDARTLAAFAKVAKADW